MKIRIITEVMMKGSYLNLKRIEFADNVGINVFGVGEHHRKEFLDSAPHILLSAAATKTSKLYSPVL